MQVYLYNELNFMHTNIADIRRDYLTKAYQKMMWMQMR